jgi:hypothetical protein
MIDFKLSLTVSSLLFILFVAQADILPDKLVSKSQTKVVPLGFAYCNSNELNRAEQIVRELNSDSSNLNAQQRSRVRLDLKSLRLKGDDDPITLSLTVCDNLMLKEFIHGIIIGNTECLRRNLSVSDEKDYILTISSVSFTCAYYQIPVVDLNHREAAFSDEVNQSHYYCCFFLFFSNVSFSSFSTFYSPFPILTRAYTTRLFACRHLTFIKLTYGLKC